MTQKPVSVGCTRTEHSCAMSHSYVCNRVHGCTVEQFFNDNVVVAVNFIVQIVVRSEPWYVYTVLIRCLQASPRTTVH